MLNRLLITGANGALGSVCRARLGHLAKTLRISARRGLGEAGPNEELVYCNLDDRAGVEALVDGCDGIVHMGGQAREACWETIRQSNIEGVFNLFEAARKSSVTPRIVFASSNHAIGYHTQNTRLDVSSPTRPDSLYGVSKVFGESMASMYFDKFGIETASIRIGSTFPEPRSHRMLATWLSYDDMISLIECIFRVPRAWVARSSMARPTMTRRGGTIDQVAYLGWRPKDNAETVPRTRSRPSIQEPPAPTMMRSRSIRAVRCSVQGILEAD